MRSAAEAVSVYIQHIKHWMSQNCLQLKQDKTEVLIIGSKAQREKRTPNLNTLGLNPKIIQILTLKLILPKRHSIICQSKTISLSDQYREINACINN